MAELTTRRAFLIGGTGALGALLFHPVAGKKPPPKTTTTRATTTTTTTTVPVTTTTAASGADPYLGHAYGGTY